MFNSSVIDVAIGLVFVFLLISLICSAANELLEGLLNQRSSNLLKGITELVGDASFVDKLYNHGLINGLFRGTFTADVKKRTKQLPSYIPSRNFAAALISIAKETPAVSLPTNVKTALAAFTATSPNDPASVQKKVEDWYNSSMDRVSGWYKRQSQYNILAIGLIITIGINADCVLIARRLSTDATLRQAAVKAAEQEASKAQPAVSANPSEGATGSSSAQIDKIKDYLSTLDGVGLPIGWSNEGPFTAGKLFGHFPGWILTAIAVSLGAPFWFDVLNKIIVVRSTVKPHEKSQDEGSKDAVQSTPSNSPESSDGGGSDAKPEAAQGSA